MPAVGALVRCTDGRWMVRPPEFCPRGHRIDAGQVLVGHQTATAVFTPGPAPSNDQVLVSSSAAAFIGPSGVTTTTGLPIAANTVVLVPVTGAETLQLFAVVASGTATVSYFFPS